MFLFLMTVKADLINERHVALITILSVFPLYVIEEVIQFPCHIETTLTALCANCLLFNIMQVNVVILQPLCCDEVEVTFITVKWMGNLDMLVKLFLIKLYLTLVAMCFILMLIFRMFF